jgi:hypothetical protein
MGRTTGVPERLQSWSRERRAERATAACYGTVLVLAALVVIDADEVASGLGWELVTGVGLATLVAHLYAEVVGDHLRHAAALGRREVKRAMADGSPILLATVLPALILLLGRIGVLTTRSALWLSVAVAVLQLVGVGSIVGLAVSPRGSHVWVYAAVTAGFGVIIVLLKLVLGH